MAPAEPRERYRLLWEAALRDAAGPLSAYLTPEAFGVSLHSVAASPESGSRTVFAHAIRRRLDLGRAARVGDLIGSIKLTSSYRHELTVSQGIVRGKIHVPRLMSWRARGRGQTIPVIRAERNVSTPENLLVSELIRWSLAISRDWMADGGAEAKFARRLYEKLSGFESAQPWAHLRDKPRPKLSELSGLVLGRVKSGWCERGSAVHELALIAAGQQSAETFQACAGPLSYLGVDDSRFEDRLFELLCLAWLVRSLSDLLDDVEIVPVAIKGSPHPVLIGRAGPFSIRLFYQAGHLGKSAKWAYRRGNRPLRAIPDLLIEAREGPDVTHMILDAKNRSAASPSEVIYKLLGYKENLNLQPYWAVGMFPGLSSTPVFQTLERGQSRVVVFQLPLGRGQRLMRWVLRTILAAAKQQSIGPIPTKIPASENAEK